MAALDVMPPVKRPPGRPKKAPVLRAVQGIIQPPENNNLVLELVCNDPSIFEQIYKVLKSYETKEVEFIFDPEGLSIQAKDHSMKSDIIISVPGKYMESYFCIERIPVCLSRASIDGTFGIIAGSHTKIVLSVATNSRSNLNIDLCEKEKDYEISLDMRVPTIQNVIQRADEIDYDETKYALHFEIPLKLFKERYMHTKALRGKQFIIQKCGKEDLQLTHEDDTQVKVVANIPMGPKNVMRSALNDGDMIRVSVPLSSVTPITGIAAKNIAISADNSEPLVFTILIGQVAGGYSATIRVFTRLFENRFASMAPDEKEELAPDDIDRYSDGE